MLVEIYKDVEGIIFCFASFQEELDTLQIKYALSNERLYLGKSKRKIAGCVGLKSLERTVNLYHKLRFEEIKNKPS